MSEDIQGYFGKVIHSYSRREAINDGILADVSKLAAEAGFKYHTAISTGVFNLVDEAVQKGGKDYEGVLWDIFTMLRHAIKAGQGGQRTDFKVLIWSKYVNKDKLFDMYAVVGPGDTAEPVITIMLPTED